MGEIVMRNEEQVALFSGEIMNAKPEDDLNGEVDFLFSAKPHSSILEAPILSVIEAKRGDIEISQGQCAAQMIGAYYFNQKKGRDLKEIYGCVTTGNEWAFMKLKDNVLYIDTKRYFISDLGQILGIFQYIIDNYDLK